MTKLPDILREEKVIFNKRIELIKHLKEDEVICPTCGGLGIIIDNNVFGLTGIDTTTMFPFKKQTLAYCRDCYNGIAKECKYCGSKYRDRCNCNGYYEEKEREELADDIKTWNNARKIPFSEAKDYAYLYIDNVKKYIDYDCVLDYIAEKGIRNPRLYTTEETWLSMDARGCMESFNDELHEGAIEDIPEEKIDQLQAYLDEWCNSKAVRDNTETYWMNYEVGVLMPEVPQEEN